MTALLGSLWSLATLPAAASTHLDEDGSFSLSALRTGLNTLATTLASDLHSLTTASASKFVSDQPLAFSPLLLPEVMLHVFSFMDAEDIILAGPVCRLWHEAAQDPMLWTPKVCPALAAACSCSIFNPAPSASSTAPIQEGQLRDGLVPHLHQGGLAHLGRPLALPQLHLLADRNFLRNPGFQRLLNTTVGRPSWKKWRRNAWVFPTTGGNGVAWECPPVQCELVPTAPRRFPAGSGAGGMAARAQQQLQGLFNKETHGCIATSSEWNECMQVIDFVEELQRRGLSREQAEHVLDSRLPLGFSIYVGAHAEAGGQFSACMFLLEKEPEDVLNIAQRFVAKPCRYHFYSGKLKTTAPGQWQRFAHVVEAVPCGFRFGIVLLRAKDQATCQGHYGAKLACAELRLLRQHEKAMFAKGDDQGSWMQRMATAGLAVAAAAAAAPAPHALAL